MDNAKPGRRPGRSIHWAIRRGTRLHIALPGRHLAEWQVRTRTRPDDKVRRENNPAAPCPAHTIRSPLTTPSQSAYH